METVEGQMESPELPGNRFQIFEAYACTDLKTSFKIMHELLVPISAEAPDILPESEVFQIVMMFLQRLQREMLQYRETMCINLLVKLQDRACMKAKEGLNSFLSGHTAQINIPAEVEPLQSLTSHLQDLREKCRREIERLDNSNKIDEEQFWVDSEQNPELRPPDFKIDLGSRPQKGKSIELNDKKIVLNQLTSSDDEEEFTLGKRKVDVTSALKRIENLDKSEKINPFEPPTRSTLGSDLREASPEQTISVSRNHQLLDSSENNLFDTFKLIHALSSSASANHVDSMDKSQIFWGNQAWMPRPNEKPELTASSDSKELMSSTNSKIDAEPNEPDPKHQKPEKMTEVRPPLLSRLPEEHPLCLFVLALHFQQRDIVRVLHVPELQHCELVDSCTFDGGQLYAILCNGTPMVLLDWDDSIFVVGERFAFFDTLHLEGKDQKAEHSRGHTIRGSSWATPKKSASKSPTPKKSPNTNTTAKGNTNTKPKDKKSPVLLGDIYSPHPSQQTSQSPSPKYRNPGSKAAVGAVRKTVVAGGGGLFGRKDIFLSDGDDSSDGSGDCGGNESCEASGGGREQPRAEKEPQKRRDRGPEEKGGTGEKNRRGERMAGLEEKPEKLQRLSSEERKSEVDENKPLKLPDSAGEKVGLFGFGDPVETDNPDQPTTDDIPAVYSELPNPYQDGLCVKVANYGRVFSLSDGKVHFVNSLGWCVRFELKTSPERKKAGMYVPLVGIEYLSCEMNATNNPSASLRQPLPRNSFTYSNQPSIHPDPQQAVIDLDSSPESNKLPKNISKKSKKNHMAQTNRLIEVDDSPVSPKFQDTIPSADIQGDVHAWEEDPRPLSKPTYKITQLSLNAQAKLCLYGEHGKTWVAPGRFSNVSGSSCLPQIPLFDTDYSLLSVSRDGNLFLGLKVIGTDAGKCWKLCWKVPKLEIFFQSELLEDILGEQGDLDMERLGIQESKIVEYGAFEVKELKRDSLGSVASHECMADYQTPSPVRVIPGSRIILLDRPPLESFPLSLSDPKQGMCARFILGSRKSGVAKLIEVRVLKAPAKIDETRADTLDRQEISQSQYLSEPSIIITKYL